MIKSAVMTDKLNPAERRFNGYGDAMGALYKEGGFGRFYRGLFPCLLRASPANKTCCSDGLYKKIID